MIFAAIAFTITILLMPLSIKVAHRFGLHDIPDARRKQHVGSIPFTGGFGINAAILISIAALWSFGDSEVFRSQSSSHLTMYLYIMEAAVVIIVLGIIDDFVELSFAKKFIFEFFAATFIILGAIRSDIFPRVFNIEESGILINSLGSIVSLLWLVGVTNAINMIDGMDGLAGGSAFLSSLSMAMLHLYWGNDFFGYVLLIIAGAMLGFLLFNIPPAKVFMGDTGSLFLGFILAVGGWLLVDSVPGTLIHVFIPVLLLGLPVSDTLLSFFRRVITGHNPFNADTFHIHHMLKHRFQLSSKRTVHILWGVNLVYCLFGLSLAVVPELVGWIMLGVLAVAQIGFLHLLGYTELYKNRKGVLAHPPVFVRKKDVRQTASITPVHRTVASQKKVAL